MQNKLYYETMIVPGISDDKFIRLEHVPMTKEEVRVISLCKLKPVQDGIIYDIGAGTGSVSVECARLCPKGTVYALEQKENACRAIALNKEKFRLKNLEIIQGTAPQGLRELPSPTHVFIGGTGGHLQEIYDALAEKKTEIRVVLTAVTLETVSEMTILAQKEHLEPEIVQISVSKAKEMGDYHLMMGQNPVTIFSFTIGENEIGERISGR